MSFPLTTLSRLLVPAATEIGTVVAIEGSAVRVATARGAVLARTVDAAATATSLAVGDRVQLHNGIATRSPVARQVYPV